MKRLLVLLAPAIAFSGQARYARLGEFDGKAEVQIEAPDPWLAAVRNLPLPEGAWVRTGSGARLEAELDEGSAVRLTPDSQIEFSDLKRLSTGQRVTLLSLDHGITYFTGMAEGHDSLILAVPGAQVTVRKGSRVRLEAREQWSQIAVIEGVVRFSSPAAELDLKEGQMARVEVANPSRFWLYREVTPLETDRWSEERDKALASPTSAAHLSDLRCGLADLDSAGTWTQTEEFGTVWKPKMAVAWVPFRDGKWVWYEGLGYTWVSAEPWGWLPFHYGRWMLREGMGWFWVPGTGAIFKPGETFWLAGKGVAGWGPLAPGEVWVPPAMPQLFLNAHTTFAKFAPDSREIDPAGFASRPREPLSTATFVAAMPSPAFPAARLDAVRPVLRAGSTRVVLNLPGVTFESAAPVPERQRVSETVAGNPPPVAQTQTVIQPASPQPAVVVTVPQPEQPMEVYYPVPVYTGVVVVNPPERNHGHRREPERPLPANPTPVTRSPDKPPEQIVPQAPAPAPAVRRTETDHRRPEQAKAEPERPKPEPAKEEKSDNPDQPIPRNQESGRQPDSGRRK